MAIIYPAIELQLKPPTDGKFWDFTSDLAKGDTAYTTMALQAHTDTTYFASSLPRLLANPANTVGTPD